MSKIAVCYFSYHKDKEFLNNSLKVLYNTIERHPEHEVRVYVFDDGRYEKSLKKKELVGEPTLIKTNFDRKGNLNGYECINGMFNEYAKIMQKFEYDYLVKLDSDCVLNSFDYLYHVEKEVKKNNLPMDRLAQIGSFFARICIFGCCQTFGRAGIIAVYNLFAQMNKSQNKIDEIMKRRVELGYNEDKVTSVLLEMAPVLRINIDSIPGIKGHCNAFDKKDVDYHEYTSVAFKPNYFSNISDWDRNKSLDEMNKYVNNL